MYQGKFAEKNRGQAKKEAKLTAESQALNLEEEISERESPLAPQQEPAKKEKKQKKQKRPKKKANRVISTIFYTLYFLLIIGFFGGMYFVTDWLEDWLVSFEASQPTTRSEEVFQANFANPDWNKIYDLAGIQSTVFEGKEDFVAYMENKYGDVTLTYTETSAGLSGDHKYHLKNGDDYIGYFTLTDKNSTGVTNDPAALITSELPDWQLGEVSVSFTRNESVTIQKVDGHTAYVNGVEVTDEFTNRIASTIAENYLPEGTTGFRSVYQSISGLLLQPEVTIVDENGNPTTVNYDETTGVYVEQTEATTISEEEKQLVIDAAEAYGEFMIEKKGSANLAKFWKSSTDIFKTITTLERWFAGAAGYEFVNENVTDYVRYTDKLFSARVAYTLNATRTNGKSVKEFNLDTTLFFERQKSGKWLVIDMTNVDVQKEISEVRISFLDTAGNVVSTEFMPDDTSEIFAPTITVPAGQQFAGWFKETVDASGTKTLQLVFTPDESGLITVPHGTTLEPMTLIPVFEAVKDAPASTEPAESEAA